MPYNIIATAEADHGHQARRAFCQTLASVPHLPKVILPTGSSPAPFYQSLRDHPSIPSFSYLQLDEYLGLDVRDKRLFSKWLDRDVLNPLNIQNRMIFNSAANPDDEVRRILAWYKQHGAADMAVIGIGLNGHIGFNEPGSSFDSRARVVTLTPETIAANQSYWNGGKVPTRAITLGIADLKEVEHTILLVRGAAKAEILYRALHGPVTPEVPASYLQQQRNLIIVADRPALAMMP